MLEFRILGPFEVRRDGSSIPLRGPKQRALLATLVINAGRTVSKDRLIEALWPGDVPKSAHGTLHTHLTHVRQALAAADVIHTEATGYRLEIAPDQIDAARFEAMASRGRELSGAGETGDARQMLADALELWRGPALEEFVDSMEAHSEAIRLDELRRATTESRIEADLHLGRHAEVVAELEALVAAHPLRERLWADLMVSLYRSGRKAEALRAFQRAREHLIDIGLDPSHKLTDLESRILVDDPGLARDRDAPGERDEPTEVGPRTNLPASVSTLIGRETETAEVSGLLEDHRLVTLVGIGGVGKSRLALRVAGGLVDRYEHGVWLVDLQDLGPEDVLQAIADALGITEDTGRSLDQAVRSHLVSRESLLVVDNAEEIASAAASVLEGALRHAPRLKVLATSRLPLMTAGERIVRLTPLAYPADELAIDLQEYDAVRLFAERAAAVAPGFQLDREVAPDIAGICADLDGIPAAIELAAARAHVLSPRQIRDAMDAQLDASAASETPVPRQSVPAVAAWSYDLLDEAAQQLLRRLSVFSGGFTLELAQQVGAPQASLDEVIAMLSSYVDLALITPQPGAEMRYIQLEILRRHGRNKLVESGEADEIRHSHAEAMTRMAEGVEQTFGSPKWHGSLAALDIEQKNMQRALRWCLDGRESDLAARLAGSLGRYWKWRGRYEEGNGRLNAVLDAIPDPSAHPKVLREAAGLARMTGDLERSDQLAAAALEAFEAAGDAPGRADALYDMGMLSIFRSDFSAAERQFAESADVWRALGATPMLAFPVVTTAWVYQVTGDYQGAEACWSEILSSLDTSRLPMLSGITFRLADLALDQGQFDRAEEIAASSLERAAAANFPYHEGGARYVMARLAYCRGDLDAAHAGATAYLAAARRESAVEGTAVALRLLAWIEVRRRDPGAAARRVDELSRIAPVLGGSYGRLAVVDLEAMLAALDGRIDVAVMLLAAAAAGRDRHGLPLSVPEAEERDADIAELKSSLDEERFSSQWELGGQMSLTAAVDIARAGRPIGLPA